MWEAHHLVVVLYNTSTTHITQLVSLVKVILFGMGLSEMTHILKSICSVFFSASILVHFDVPLQGTPACLVSFGLPPATPKKIMNK